MKDIHFGKSKANKIFSGKGFYVALIISLVAVGTATFFAANRTIDKLNGGDTLNLTSSDVANEWGFPKTEDANKNQSGISKDSSKSSQGSGQQSTSSGSTQTSQNNTSGQTGSQKSSGNTFTMPISGEIINNFSDGELVKSKTLGDWRTHDGIDIKGKVGTPVKSAADGTVTDIKEDSLWGVTVIIDHKNGYTGHYYGLNATVNVKKGQTVSVGDVIGSVGETAQIEIGEESHLHFGLKKDGKWVDPSKVIKKIS
ncbi:MAG: peptidase [Oscillospiraceae bacterium]|jgi:murein DD-endopeptidase MepM/ murein hydrolase activator NlpD|nr:peptidase [Oscillospiraceae bacterium]